MGMPERDLAPVELVPQFAVSLDVIRQRIGQLQEFVKGYMVQGEDYGVIPGTPKPTLLKPGAEKLCDVYALSPQYDVTHRVEEWDKPLFSYEVRCTLVSRQSGIVIAQGVGSCNSYEKKYRYRRDGSENPDPFTLVNTLLKMAKKRALVDAVLSATRSSGIFTQDIEDLDLGDRGDAAGQQGSGRQQGAGRPQQPLTGKVSESQVRYLKALISRKEGADDIVQSALDAQGVSGLADLSKQAASELINLLQDRPEKEAAAV